MADTPSAAQDHEVEGTVPSQWWLDLKLENQRLREELRLVRLNAASADPVFGGVGREGMVTVWDDEGRYVGCMGVNLWRHLLTVSGGPIDG